ncbi:MAG: SMI1/KNR4 family protein [Aphanizomenon gracile PMC644.10]|nr:SMI1/KNR4 family protein [Aphanizomenon gracile PMC644.10]
MINYTEKLVSIGSQPLDDRHPYLSQILLDIAGSMVEELYSFLSKKNGFLAFESALHVFPANNLNGVMNLETWNSDELWRKDYGALAENCLFFAEDIFGGQFCIFNNEIYSFDPETGNKEVVADNIEQWAKLILEDYNVLTGFPLAHQWQQEHGILPINKRLLPKIPFVAGGRFTVDNLYSVDSVKGMKVRADIAQQIHNLPDGTKITVRLD